MADAAAASAALGTPVATVDAPDTATIPLQDPGTSVDVSATAPTGVATDPGQPSTDTIAPQASPAYQDPEMRMGATHQNWLSHIIDTVGSMLGGDQTLTITKSPDGSIKVDHNPSTTGEKWGRIAAAALGGAAKGLAAGQGPGGAARAVAAGTAYGLQLPQQQLDQANQQAANMSAQQLRNAQNIALNQQIFATAFNNSHLAPDYLHKQTVDAMALAKEMDDLHAVPIAKGIKNGAEIVQYGKTNPGAVQSHLGTDGSMLFNIPDGQGGVDVYQIPANIANRLTTDDDHWVQTVLDPKDGTKTVDNPGVTMAGQETNAQRATRRMALSVSNTTNIKDAQTARTAASEAATKAAEVTQKAPLTQAQIAEQTNLSRLHAAQANLITGGAGAGGAASSGLHGDAYLQAAVDPAMQQQVKAIANGDVKMPSANRSPANQAIRNAVFNYDPTFTDARYDTKQNFKTKGDSQNLQSLSTALEHVERASTNSAALGNSPSLLTGRNLSGAAAAYNQDVNLFTEEAGKLVKGGVIGEHEFNALKQGMQSPVQSIRDSAIKETVNLLGGRINAGFNKYRVGAGQDIPVQEFFDQPTQQRLQRYGITQQPPAGSTANTQTTNPAANTTPAKNVVPAGATPGRDPATGKVIGYRTPDGTVVRF